MWTKVFIPAVIVSMALAGAANAAAVYTFQGGDLADPAKWTLSSGAPGRGSPPPANGAIGVIAAHGVIKRTSGPLYHGVTEKPPSELRIVEGGVVSFNRDIKRPLNFVLDGGELNTHQGGDYRNWHLRGDIYVRSGGTIQGGIYDGALMKAPGGSAADTADAPDPVVTIKDRVYFNYAGRGGTYDGTTVVKGVIHLARSGGLDALGIGDIIVRGTISFDGGDFKKATVILDGGTFLWHNNRHVSADVRLRSDSTFRSIHTNVAPSMVGPINDDGDHAGKLIKTGSNRLYLDSHNNRYTGGTEIVQGHLIVRAAGGLGYGDVVVDPAGKLTLGTAGAIRSSQNMIVKADHSDYGIVQLAANQIVNTLTLGGVGVAPGTYAAASRYKGVDFSDYFIGTHTVKVLKTAKAPKSAPAVHDQRAEASR